jgi:NTP pyrophosphatase (non-canonical NTP hydrolase)
MATADDVVVGSIWRRVYTDRALKVLYVERDRALLADVENIEQTTWHTRIGVAYNYCIVAPATVDEQPAERANDNEGPFSLGQTDCWPGLSKLIEECGEVIQVAGNLAREMEDELGDLLAAVEFFNSHNRTVRLDQHRIVKRMVEKLALFREWHAKTVAP